MERTHRIDYYLRMALMVAERSTCFRGKVGAILTNHNRIVGVGYNGGPKGTRHCIDKPLPVKITGNKVELFVPHPTPQDLVPPIVAAGCGCITDELGRCAISIHAEVNAILSREGQHQPTDELVMYCTHQPCRHCYRIMKQYGVSMIYYIKEYPDEVRDKLRQEWNLPMNQVNINVI